MRFPDATALVIAWLAAGLDAPVSSKVPKDRPVLFLTARRVGGTSANPVLDQPQIRLDAWGPNEIAAGDLLEEARQRVFAMDGGVPLIRSVAELAGPYENTDPLSLHDRISCQFILKVRASSRA